MDFLLQAVLILAAFSTYALCASTDNLPKWVSFPLFLVAVSFFFCFICVRFVEKQLSLGIFFLGASAILSASTWLFFTYRKPIPEEVLTALNRRLLIWLIPALVMIILLLLVERQPMQKYLQPPVPTTDPLQFTTPSNREQRLQAQLDSARSSL